MSMPRYVKDWTTLTGARIEIRMQGQVLDSGRVDAVTDDGTILWLLNPAQIRKIYERAEYYSGWMIEEPTVPQDRGAKGATPRPVPNPPRPSPDTAISSSPARTGVVPADLRAAFHKAAQVSLALRLSQFLAFGTVAVVPRRRYGERTRASHAPAVLFRRHLPWR